MHEEMMNLSALGWDDSWERAFSARAAQGMMPGRVAVEDRGFYQVLTREGELSAQVSGKLLHQFRSPSAFPKVGDWVALSRMASEKKGVIHGVLPRRTRLSRKAPGREMEEQVLVANMDVAFLVQGLDATFKPRRLQRHLLMVHEGGATPVVVLNKADLCPELESLRLQVSQAAGEVPVISLSALTGENVGLLEAWLRPGRTVVFIGASGSGKSTLINRLSGQELQATAGVRAGDAKGRHTTTSREMILLPNGALVIDTPGMREFHLWEAEDGLQETFPDLEDLAVRCHFSNCTHSSEPRCAIREAVESGRLARDRYDSYRKLKRELDYLDITQSRSGSARKYKPPGRFTHKTRR